ncbi:MAG TPA: CRISPR-associated ring nuclease Csm6 [Rhodocyclaceae bacterium]|nr:CRISPR-associated ring nuclease Csm6 [Rhodocyclaceae bacterium]
MLAPTDYPRRILLAVTGLSPQVVTETLYALAVANDAPFVPTEIHLITTSEGAERARLALLSDRPGWFHRLRHDYGLPEIAFDANAIHILRDATGRPLADIRSPADNLACADFIAEAVRNLSADPDAALHVSLAGGRKTMGFFLGYALSLFGRPQDRLSHVLVSEPFESSWDFFYPTPYESIIETIGKKLVDARDARLSLAEIPFVSLRHGLPTALLDGSTGFEAAVSAARATLGPARLELDLAARQVRAAGRSFHLPPAELALLAVFARREREGEPPLPAPHKDIPDPAWAERYLRELRIIVGPFGDIEATERALRGGMDGGFFSSRLSKLRRALKRQLGPAAAPYLIDDGGRRPHRYRLALPADAVAMSG